MIDKPASTTALATTPDTPTTDKPRRISRRIQQGIAAIVSGKVTTLKAAADEAGLSYWHFVRELKKPHIQVFIALETRRTIANGMMRASARMVELLGARSEHVAFDSARHILAIGGIKPAAEPQVSLNIDVRAGYVIDIGERENEPEHIVAGAPRVIEHDPAPLSERPSAKHDE